jgi:hypothetical protein
MNYTWQSSQSAAVLGSADTGAKTKRRKNPQSRTLLITDALRIDSFALPSKGMLEIWKEISLFDLCAAHIQSVTYDKNRTVSTFDLFKVSKVSWNHFRSKQFHFKF